MDRYTAPQSAAEIGRMHVSDFRSPWWLPGAHLQTIFPGLVFRRTKPLPLKRERWHTPDGDFIDVDELAAPPGAPLMLLFHGLEGGARSHYAIALAHACRAAGWRLVLPHFRGCSGEANLLPRAYHSGDTEEADWILRRVRATADGPFCAVGVSLGGNVLLKWLGEQGDAARDVLRAAVAVSVPVDLHAAGNALERGLNMIYTRMFLATLVAKSLEILARFPGSIDESKLRQARTLRDFDDIVTAPLHGFADVADYWTRASSKPALRGVRVPSLLLNARNDPFLPAQHLPEPHEVSSFLTLEYPETGGHVGFLSGAFPGHVGWLPQRILQFFDQAKTS